MVYKRYIKRGGKVYGPYTYHSVKKDGKVVSEYIGKGDAGSVKQSANKNLLFALGFLFVLSLLFLTNVNLRLTGNVIVSVEENYFAGEQILGSVKLSLAGDEIIPAGTKVVVNNSGEVSSYVLSDLVSGSVTPSDSIVSFILSITSAEGNQTSAEVNETSAEVVNETVTSAEVNETETVEVVNETSEEVPIEELTSVNESSSFITGAVIFGNVVESSELSFVREVSGEVSVNNSFSYNLSSNESAQIKSGSVKIWRSQVGSGELTVDERQPTTELSGLLELETINNVAIVTTDYVGSAGKEILINLSDLNLVAKEGELKISLESGNETLAFVVQEISVLANESVNDSVSQNVSLGNETVDVIVNETLFNQSLLNETLGNESLFNVTDGNLTIETIQFDAVINRPVKWKKKIFVNGSFANFSVEIPKQAVNVSVYKIVESVVVNDLVNETVETAGLSTFSSFNSAEAEVKDKEKVREKIEKKIDKDKDNEDVIEIIIDEFQLNDTVQSNSTEIEIEYETPGPKSDEQNISGGKQIIVYDENELNLTNILAFTFLPGGVKREFIKLYHIINQTNFTSSVRELVKFAGYDLNNDSFVDYIEWVVPHLSNQTYELEINILNLQSYPVVGGNWTVKFNTTGVGNLSIKGFNQTLFGFNSSADLVFLDLMCGNVLQNASVVINGTEVPYDVYLKKRRIEEIRGELG